MFSKPSRKKLVAAVVAAALGGSSDAVRATVVVIDPTNLASNLQQVAQDIQLLAQMEQQVQNQLRMLERWNFTRLDQILAEMARLDGIFRDAGPTYEDRDAEGALERHYPTSYGDDARQQHEALEPQWEQRHRDVLVENRRVQNEVAQSVEPTRQRVAEYVEHSNSAPGVTAAMQAGNEVVATLAGQLQALEVLEVTEARAESEQYAREQSEDAYAAQRRAWVMRDWQAPADPMPVESPFGN